MLFLALSIVVVTLSITSCFSKTTPKVANAETNPNQDDSKKRKKEKKLNLIEVTATQKTENPQISKIENLKPPTQPDDVKNPAQKKQESSVLAVKTASLDPKEGKKLPPPPPHVPLPKPETKKSSYAGIHEKSAPKPPTPKLASVITIPTKSTETTVKNQIQESPKNQKDPPKKGSPMINDKSDDTIEDIPSVRVKEGVSYEGDGPPIKSPDGIVTGGQKTLEGAPPPQIQKKSSKEKTVETVKSVEGEKK